MDSERILNAIGECHRLISDSKNLKHSIQDVISKLGQATEVDRVYVFKNYRDKSGGSFFSYKFEWVAEGVEPQLGLPLLEYVPWDAFSNIAEELAKNMVMNQRVEDNQNELFRETMEVQGILAFLFLPVFTGDHFWGFIGFDNCSTNELFSDEQKTALHALANTLGAVILNRKQRKRIYLEKQKYQTIVNNVGEVLFKLDDEFKVTFLNKSWTRITGYSITDGVGRVLSEFIYPPMVDKFWNDVNHLLESWDKTGNFETKLITKNGDSKWVKISLLEMEGNAAERKSYSGFIIDIDREKQARYLSKEISSRYETVLRNVSDVIYALDRNGATIFISENIQNFGFSPEAYLRTGFLDSIIHPGDHDTVQPVMAGLMESNYFNINYRILNSDKKVFWVNDRRWVEYSEIDEEYKIYGRISDISDLKNKELEIEKNRSDLFRLNELLQTVNETQVNFLFEEDFKESLDELLVKILALTGSRFGFMGEILFDEQEKPYLRSHTITNIAWSEETEEFYQRHFKVGIEFRNLNTLFGYSIAHGVPVISNDPSHDPRGGGIPEGHPPLRAYLGIPVFKNKELLGLIGLANKEGGYSESDIEFLRPITNSYANFVKAIRISRLRKAAEDEREKTNRLFKLLSESANDIIAFHDLDGTFRFVSPSVFKILGYQPEELIGKTPTDVFGVMDSRAFKRKTSEVLIAPHKHRISGKLVYLEISINYLSEADGAPKSYLAVSRDVTERELMLERLVKSYEKEKELNMLKSRFISMTSHELRTPISTILSSNQILKSYLSKLEDSILMNKSLGHVEKINRQVKRLNGTIEDILILEKNAQGSLKIKIEPIQIKAFLEELCVSFCEEHPGLRKQTMSFPSDDRTVYTDKNLLRHVLSNLIENAVKYGKPDGEGTELQLEFNSKDIQILVKDRGIGIPEADQKHIFGSFYRAKNADLIPGTGLGLHIVQEFTSRLRGTISFVSKENEGTTFKLTLPYGSEDTIGGR
ncbi:PAS domain S-box protein [Lunatimonas lonarensis]|nr:PAS domain S-box protein [Lunatimonas lonarensis]